MISPATIVTTIEEEVNAIFASLETHRLSRAIFTLAQHPFRYGTALPEREVEAYRSSGDLKKDYVRLLEFFAHYIPFTVPLLRETVTALEKGDEVDQEWGRKFSGYVSEEALEEGGHEQWVYRDLQALEAPPLEGGTHPLAVLYTMYFQQAIRNGEPYIYLGDKLLLEALSEDMSPLYAQGLKQADLGHAASFFTGHEVDEQHGPEGRRDLEQLNDPDRLEQVRNGVLYASHFFRSGLEIF